MTEMRRAGGLQFRVSGQDTLFNPCEPSMSLAPQVVAEQNTSVALRYADYGYILESGRIVLDGPARVLTQNKDVKEFYLGLASEGRTSFRTMKSYRRGKRGL